MSLRKQDGVNNIQYSFSYLNDIGGVRGRGSPPPTSKWFNSSYKEQKFSHVIYIFYLD